MWTDKQLCKEYKLCGEPAERDLYRLARLGLAAEQVALAWQRNEVLDTKVPLTILDHPAWEAK